MAHTVYELDVRLREIEPPIWRTIEVPGAATLEDVHYAIQVAMGWTNSHLHQFTIGDASYGIANAEEEFELEDESEFLLQNLVQAGGSFVYEYDFGDGWEHDVRVVKVSTTAKAPKARCTDGARACPPENCGGSGGYQDLVHAMRDPGHRDHEDSLRWAADFDPERFSVPPSGRDLRAEMEELRQLAAQDQDEDFAIGFEFGDDEGHADLPAPLVNAVLGLDPMQRAALAAVIASSLALELTEAQSMAVGPEVSERHQRVKAARKTRKRDRRRGRRK